MSIGKILSTARQAISVHQAAIQITGQNVANATTPGYTRQGVISSNIDMKGGISDGGVYVVGLSRPRDRMLDGLLRRETSTQSSIDVKKGILSQAETVLGELTEAGVSRVLEQFWSGWSDLATSPTGGAQREIIRQRGELVVTQFKNLNTRIEDIRQSSVEQAHTSIQLINDYAEQIKNLNLKIAVAEGTGQDVPDLRDGRDLLLDKLSELTSITVKDNTDGTVTIITGEEVLVDRGMRQEVTAGVDGDGKFGLSFSLTSGNTKPSSGKVGGILDMLNSKLPDLLNRLDKVVEQIVREVNEIHRNGTDSSGSSGVDFFDPAGVTMKTFGVSSVIRENPAEIRSGSSGRSGDGDVATSLSRLRYKPIASLGNRSLTDAYQDITISIAIQVENYDNISKTQDALVSQITNQRSSLTDVSIEEEMMALQKYQQAYTAATKMVAVADEMIQDILKLR